MYLFDNDALKLAVAGDENTLHRVQRNLGRIWISSIAAEELLTAYMNGINRARSPRNSLSLARAHRDLVQALEDLHIFPILPYSAEAEAVFRGFSPATLRVGPQDCRIAAQALAHSLTVVTRNLRDFERIGAPCEDWSTAF